MQAHSNDWRPYEGGDTLGKIGPEEGMILLDEELTGTAHITLERCSARSRFAITCGIKNWLLHTHYTGIREEALSDYGLMKSELTTLVQLVRTGEPGEELAQALKAFVGQFP